MSLPASFVSQRHSSERCKQSAEGFCKRHQEHYGVHCPHPAICPQALAQPAVPHVTWHVSAYPNVDTLPHFQVYNAIAHHYTKLENRICLSSMQSCACTIACCLTADCSMLNKCSLNSALLCQCEYLKQVCKLRVALRDPFEEGALASTDVALYTKCDTP